MENLTNDTPPKKGFWTPLVRYVFHPPQVSVLCFPVQESTTEQTRSSFGGVQKFSGERVLWYVFLPPYVLHPPMSRPKFSDHYEILMQFTGGLSGPILRHTVRLSKRYPYCALMVFGVSTFSERFPLGRNCIWRALA